MPLTVRNRAPWNRLSVQQNMAQGAYVLGDGTTAGKVNVTMPLANQDLGFLIDGKSYQKAPTSGQTTIADVFDCSSLTDLTATQYCKVLCLLNSSGTGSILQGDIATAQAIAPLPDVPADKAVVGFLQCGGVTDWDDAGGLAGQNVTYVEGFSLLQNA